MNISSYRIISTEKHTKKLPYYVKLSFWERFLPTNWGKTTKLQHTEVPDSEYIVDHVRKTITCHPQHESKLKFSLQKNGDIDVYPWFHRPI
jgi:hypothetical protein